MNETEQKDNTHGEQQKKARFGPSAPDFTPSGNSSDPRGPDNVAAGKSSDPRGEDSIGEREAAAGVGSRGAVGGAEAGLANQLGKGFTGAAGGAGGALGGLRKFIGLLVRNKKKTVAGGVIGALTTLVVFILSIGQGPLELVHLSQILAKNWRGEDNSSSVRFKNLYRFRATGDIGETRVGIFGSKSVAKTFKQLGDIGIEYTERTALGGFKTQVIDTEHPNSPFKGMSDKQIREYYGLPDDSSVLKRNGSKVTIDISSDTRANRALQRDIVKTSVGTLEKGDVVTAMKTRWLSKFFDVPDLWHPYRGTKRAALEKLISKIGNRRAARQAETEQAKPRQDAIKSRFGGAQENLKEKLGGKADIISKGLVGTAALCLVRHIAADVIQVNHGVASASALEAFDKTAKGAQTESDQDVDLVQVGATVNTFKDKKGDSIWGGKALDVTAHGGSGNGKDLPADYAQAFNRNTTVDKIQAGTDLAGVSDIICSPAGEAVQLVANVLILFTTVPLTGGASAVAYWGASQATSIAATAGTMYLLQQQLTHLLASDAIVPIPPSGPLGGNIMAYGARWGAGLSSRASGGIELADSATSVVDSELEQQDEQQFKSRGFFARMFDVNDYRSLASQTIDSADASPARELSKAASFLGNPSKLFGLFSSLFTSHAAAADKPYNWGFARYGIPASILNDPAYKNPYDNAAKVSDILDENKDDIIGRAEKCFGDTISNNGGAWDVIAGDNDTNPNSSDYIDADCNDISNPDWKRVILFVFDTRLVDAVNCWNGDDDACRRLGIKQVSGGSDSTPATAAGATFDESKLYKSSVGIGCASGTKDLGVQDGYHEGKKVKIRVCAVQSVPETGETSDVPDANGKLVVNSLVSGAVVKMFADAKAAGVSPIQASEGFRSMARQTQLYNCAPGCGVGDNPVAAPGTSNHQMGIALDVEGAMQAWMIDHGKNYGFKWYGPDDEVHFSPDGT